MGYSLVLWLCISTGYVYVTWVSLFAVEGHEGVGLCGVDIHCGYILFGIGYVHVAGVNANGSGLRGVSGVWLC